MNTWYIGLYKAFIYASVIAFIIGFCSESKTSFGAYMAGYSVLILAICLILLELFNSILGNTAVSVNSVYSIIVTTGPLLLTLGIISFIFYMLIVNKHKILEGHVSNSYNSFNNIIVLLILCQMYMLFTSIDSDQYKSTKKISKVTMSIIYFLVLLTGISSSILYIILKYYTTDGFTTIL